MRKGITIYVNCILSACCTEDTQQVLVTGGIRLTHIPCWLYSLS